MHIVHAAVDKPNKHAAITLVLVCKCMYTCTCTCACMFRGLHNRFRGMVMRTQCQYVSLYSLVLKLIICTTCMYVMNQFDSIIIDLWTIQII